MGELADNLLTPIAALSELAWRGESEFGEAGDLAVLVGEDGV